MLPTVSREIVDGSDSVHAQFELWSLDAVDRVRVTYRLTSYQYEMGLGSDVDFFAEFPRRIEPKDSSFITIDTVFTISNRRVALSQSFGGMEKASYRLIVTARPADERMSSEKTNAGTFAGLGQIAAATKAFIVRPLGFPEVVSIEDQIETLAYIATDSEYRSLKEAKTDEEKSSQLAEFWSKHVDRDLYYDRVEYANRYFTCQREGWRTFPGYIYIVAGPPDGVECFPRIERWFYSSARLQVSFQVRKEIAGGQECKSTVGYIDPYLLERFRMRWRGE